MPWNAATAAKVLRCSGLDLADETAPPEADGPGRWRVPVVGRMGRHCTTCRPGVGCHAPIEPRVLVEAGATYRLEKVEEPSALAAAEQRTVAQEGELL